MNCTNLMSSDAAAAVSDPAEFYSLYYQRVHRHLAWRTKSQFLADDLAQDTLLQAIRRIDGFTGRGSLESWVFTIANNMLRRHLRREKTLRKHAGKRGEMPAYNAIPEDRDLIGEAVADLRFEINSLPRDLRLPLELTALKGMNYEEAARALGLEVSTLRMRIYRAKRILAQRLERHKNLF